MEHPEQTGGAIILTVMARDPLPALFLAGVCSPLSQEVLLRWLPGYVAAGIAYSVCFGCASVYITRERPQRRVRSALTALVAGVLAASVRYVWP
jgi:hypothetical protein